MTDEDLIRLLSEKSPRDLTIEEIAQLRLRVRQSSPVRQALERAVQFEGELSAALGTVNLSVESLLARAEERARMAPRRSLAWRWWSLVGLTASLLAVAMFWPERPDPVEIAGPAPETVKPAAETPSPAEESLAEATMIPTEPVTEIAAATTLPASMPPQATSSRTAPAPEGPWTEWLADTAEPLGPDSPQFVGDLASIGLDRLTKSEFEAWWQAIPGQPFGVSQDKIGDRPTVNFDGWAQLRAPWVADTLLRFVPFEQRELTLYFWRGAEGLALKYHREREPHTWAAYRVKRVAGERTPNWWGLLTTDSGSYYRSNAAIADVGIAEGRLCLSVAGVVLLSAPSPDPPEEVLLQAQSRLRGFRWVRAAPPSLPPVRENPNVLASSSPAAWDWQAPADGTMMLQRDADGSVTLTSTSKSEIVRAHVPLPQAGLYETLIQVASADPGTGVYLGDAAGKPLAHVTFSRDRRTEQLTFVTLRPNERRDESDYQLRDFPPPYFVERQWLRVVGGMGIWHTSCSADGIHFGHVTENPLRDVRGSIRSIGLFCWPSDTPKTIRLNSARVQKLGGVYALTAGLPAVDPPPSDVEKLRFSDSWWSEGWERRPAGVAPDLWWDAWAVATLEQGPTRELADALVTRLLASARHRLPPAERWNAFDDLMSLSDHWLDERSRVWEKDYATVGIDLEVDHPAATGEEAWKRWVTSPCWAYRGQRVEFQRRLAHDVLAAVARKDWDTTRAVAMRTQTWLATAHPDQPPREQAELTDRVVRWGKALSLEALGRTAATIGDVLPVGWRHPLQLPVNKEAYNVHAELQSALESGSYADACRIVESLQPQALSGLLPEANDPDLMVSLDVALQLATDQSALFRERLKTELTPTGQLHVRQAIADADAAAIEGATIQFWGTAPGGAARAWLGDRSLSQGDAVGAVLRYRGARRWADAALEAQLGPKLYLAEGLAGLSNVAAPGASPPASISIGGEPVSQILTVAGATGHRWATAATSAAAAPAALQAQRYRWEKLARFDGQGGQNAGRGEYREGDAFSRQFAVALDEQRVYISNRFQVNAYDRQAGGGVWAQGLGNEQGEAHGFPFATMAPVLSGEHLYVRRLAKSGAELVCLRAADGELRWVARPEVKSHVVSDPIVLGDSVWALISRPTDQEQLDLSWTQFSVSTGKAVRSTPLLRLRDAWDGQVPVALAADGLNVVAALGGVIVGFDLEGTVRWVRRELWVPPKVDPLTENHFLKSPVIQGNQVYVSSLNGRRALALSVDTGKEIWSTPLAELQGLLHVDADLVLAAESGGLVGLETTSGQILWRQPLERGFGVVSVGTDSLWAVRHQIRAAERGWLQGIELHCRSGTILREVPWDLPEAEDWRFGPWWVVGDSVWALAGQGWRDPKRDLVRLTPLNGDRAEDWSVAGLGAWTSPLPIDRQRDVQGVLPGWQVYGVPADRFRRESGDVRGETDVLVIRSDGSSTVRLVRTIPPSATALQMRIGCDPNQSVRWQVLLDGAVLLEETTGPDAPPWRTVTVPLNAAATVGRVLQIVAAPVNQGAFTSYWKRLVVDTGALPKTP
ncbi:MAG: PQQ-binding-like beta-propeller repeat protein [Planctomycetaceae bacterium]|nr:PQQ-binding-like beta-propeller repeat protein [Planctomycetaceae bacterium]